MKTQHYHNLCGTAKAVVRRKSVTSNAIKKGGLNNQCFYLKKKKSKNILYLKQKEENSKDQSRNQ